VRPADRGLYFSAKILLFGGAAVTGSVWAEAIIGLIFSAGTIFLIVAVVVSSM
jgi:hypothetical protein